MQRSYPTVVLVIGLVIAQLLALSPASADGPRTDCPFTYTVRPGDTLSVIAYRAGTSVWHLAQINRIRNVNFIYAGQVLCLPRSIEPAPSARSSFDLVVTYKFSDTADPEAMDWNLGRNMMAGKRLRYPLASGDAIETFEDPKQVLDASESAGSAPLLWLVRPNPDAVVYWLVVIGDPRPLLDLQMEIVPTQNITDIIPPPDPEKIEHKECPGTRQNVEELSLYEVSTPTLKAELVTSEGTFIPIDITEIDYHETAEIAKPCYTEGFGFALHPTANPEVDGYRLLMVLNDDGTIGPPGGRWRQHCFRWTGGGWWSRFRRAWFGCR